MACRIESNDALTIGIGNIRPNNATPIASGDRVRAAQAGGEAVLVARRDDRIADGVVRIAAAHPATAGLPAMFGPVALERLA